MRVYKILAGADWAAAKAAGRYEGAGVDRIGNPRLGRRDDAVAERQVTRDTHLPRERDAIAERRAARDAGLPCQHTVAPDLNIVAHLHEIIDRGS